MRKKVYQSIKDAYLEGIEQGFWPKDIDIDFQVTPPRQKAHGDFSTNLALILGPKTKTNPRELAKKLVSIISKNPMFQKVEIAGPGFVNIFISKEIWTNIAKEIVSAGDAFGQLKQDNETRILVEFVSANPTGPLHIGHGRGAALGDSLVRLLRAAGFNVDTEYYINNVGNQMRNLGGSVYIRYQELFGRTIEFPDDYYKGDYIADIAQIAKEKWGDKYLDTPLKDCLQDFIQIAVEHISDGIRKDLEDFGVHFDNWFPESELHNSGLVAKTLKELEAKGDIYEKDGALWFKSSAYGDEKDRVVKKADGILTYFASDIAYHRHKMERGYDLAVDIWGADHHGYVPRIKAAVEAVGYKKSNLKVLLVQLVNLIEGGQLKTMSTRAGEFVTLRDLLNDVGKDAARFIFLTRRHDSHLDFDLDLARKQNQENPVYYVQYAHARMCSVFNTAREQGIDLADLNNINDTLLVQPEEIELLKQLSAFPEVIEESANTLEPHHISYYLTNLAGLLHTYYAKHRFINEDEGLTQARLLLAKAVRLVLAQGLKILGVSAPTQM